MELKIEAPVAAQFAQIKVRFALWVPADNGPTGYAMRQIMPGINARVSVEHEAMLTPEQFERLRRFAADGDQCQFLKDLRNGPNPTTVYAIEIISPSLGNRVPMAEFTDDGGMVVPQNVAEHISRVHERCHHNITFGAPLGTTEPEAYEEIDSVEAENR